MKSYLPNHEDQSTCWMNGDARVEQETHMVYQRLVAALEFGEADSPQAVAVFSALMTTACHVFAQASVVAGDTDARVDEHLDAVVNNIVKQAKASMAEYRASMVKVSTTRH